MTKNRERDPEGNQAFCDAFVRFDGDRKAIEKHLKMKNHDLRAKLARLVKRDNYHSILKPFQKNQNNTNGTSTNGSRSNGKTTTHATHATAHDAIEKIEVTHVAEAETETVQS